MFLAFILSYVLFVAVDARTTPPSMYFSFFFPTMKIMEKKAPTKLISFNRYFSWKECAVNINSDLATPQPLYFYYNTTKFVTTTTGTSRFYLDGKQKIELFCTDGFRRPYGNHTLEAACISGNQFQIKNKSGYLIDAVCNNYPHHKARSLTGRVCVGGNIAEIGFDVRGKFYHTYNIL